MKSEEKAKKEISKATVLWILATLIFIGIDIGMFFITGPTGPWVGAVFTSLLCIVAAFYLFMHYRKTVVLPERADDASPRHKAVYARRGRDMYEICESFRRDHTLRVYAVIVICTLLCSSAVTLQTEEVKPDAPWWIIFPITAGILVLLLIFGRKAIKEDLGFMTTLHLKKAVAESGEDKIRVESDFMIASYYDLARGLMAIGASYIVIYFKTFCSVILLKDIEQASSLARIRKDVSASASASDKAAAEVRRQIRFNIRGQYYTVTFKDDVETEYAMYELQKRGIPTEECPATEW